jgi:lipopolysaccharide export system protein LptA
LRLLSAQIFFSVLLIFFVCNYCNAQQQQSANPDTMRIIQIIQGKSLRQKTIDSGFIIETIAGNAILKEGLTIFNCDSAIINHHTNIMEAFGNIHINQNDSIHTYSQHLRYIAGDRIAWLDKDVKLTDKKGILYTQTLKYDLKTNIGEYTNGGKVVNGQTILTSEDGTYYADTKDVDFKNNVHLVDPKYDIVTDSMLYNTQTQITTFITDTYIKSKKGGDIFTREGTYDLETGKAFFGSHSVFTDSTHTTYTADNSAIDETSGIAQLEGHAVIRDSINGYTILGDQIFLNKKTNTFLATRKPVLIFKGQGNDSTFIAADTLFSGIQKKDSAQQVITITDTLKQTTVANTSSDTAIRYFLAFHHVRIFNDSLQSVCDSLFYSAQDSTFRLFQQPLVFANNSQISGDTIFLYTKDRKAKRLYVFDNGMIVNQSDKQIFNQISGRTINGYFKDGELDYMRVRGSPAESVYYPQNDDSAYIGMNRSKGDVIDIYFVNKEMNKVKFINDVDGTLYPMKQAPEDQKYLKGFKWWGERRPKNKFELFE